MAAYGAYNAALEQVVLAGAITAEEAAMRKITFTADVANPPVITDESLTDLSAMGISSWRQASPGIASLGIPADVFPLTAIFAIGVPQEDGSIPGVSVPLPDQYTLTAAEQGNILTHTAQYNAAQQPQLLAMTIALNGYTTCDGRFVWVITPNCCCHWYGECRGTRSRWSSWFMSVGLVLYHSH